MCSGPCRAHSGLPPLSTGLFHSVRVRSNYRRRFSVAVRRRSTSHSPPRSDDARRRACRQRATGARAKSSLRHGGYAACNLTKCPRRFTTPGQQAAQRAGKDAAWFFGGPRLCPTLINKSISRQASGAVAPGPLSRTRRQGAPERPAARNHLLGPVCTHFEKDVQAPRSRRQKGESYHATGPRVIGRQWCLFRSRRRLGG